MTNDASLLARIRREASATPHSSPFPAEENGWMAAPYADIGRRAVEALEESCEIVEFMNEYTLHIAKQYSIEADAAKRAASEVVGYCTGYVDDAQANRW